MPIADPCCPDDNKALRRIIAQNTYISNYYQMLLDDGTPESFAPDAPATFSTSDEPSETPLRESALCKLVKNFVDGIFETATRDLVAQGVLSVAVQAIINALGGWFVDTGMVQPLEQLTTTIDEAIALADEQAKKKVICCMFDSLRGQSINYENFKNSLNACGFVADTNEDLAASVIRRYLTEENYRTFVTQVEPFARAAIAAGNVSIQGCICDCEDEIQLVDFMGHGTTYEPLGDCVYRIQQSTEDGTSGCYMASFKDALDRCLAVEFVVGQPNQSITASKIYDCTGTLVYDGTGGFVPNYEFGRVEWRLCGEPIDLIVRVTLSEA